MTANPTDSMELPRFCGIPTFMRLPQATGTDGLDAAIFGIPSDSGAPYRTGARFGPNAIREMSVMLRPINPYRDMLNVFDHLRVADLGDTPVVPGYLEETFTAIERFASNIADAEVLSCAFGGDHSVSLPHLRAVARARGTVALIHFDAHSDTWDTYFGERRDSAGTPFRRAAEENLVDPSKSIQIGLRGSLFSPTDISQSRDLGFEVVDADELLLSSVDALADRIAARVGDAPVFLSFDMDVADPAFAPGVQTPEVGGPSSFEILRLLRQLKGINLVGCDVVETNPLYDGPGKITALLAATVMAELLALAAHMRR
ncbi:agmatinase [Pseudohalocynthiibacter aestuariivivens]|nr:agmatinase [Pseudohalocynthiibacter aestuariivivens]QIE45306.1 agmatinase [Pseudohalocynthiibacter aestuariivivens]